MSPTRKISGVNHFKTILRGHLKLNSACCFPLVRQSTLSSGQVSTSCLPINHKTTWHIGESRRWSTIRKITFGAFVLFWRCRVSPGCSSRSLTQRSQSRDRRRLENTFRAHRHQQSLVYSVDLVLLLQELALELSLATCILAPTCILATCTVAITVRRVFSFLPNLKLKG